MAHYLWTTTWAREQLCSRHAAGVEHVDLRQYFDYCAFVDTWAP